MSTPHAKRRRLNEAKNTLHKPFKSPFRTPLKPRASSNDTPSSDAPNLSISDDIPVPACVVTPPAFDALTVPPRRLTFTTPSRPTPKKTSPSLTREIIQVRSDIQILSQARTLATSHKDEDLARLVDTWRTASRAAAEELFAKTRDRVNRMGGVGAWKEKEKEQKGFRQKWDREELEVERSRREGEDGDQGHGEYNTYDNGNDAITSGEGESQDESIAGLDDDSFTMDMMLRTLNIDLKLIGYDKIAQRWDG